MELKGRCLIDHLHLQTHSLASGKAFYCSTFDDLGIEWADGPNYVFA